MVLLFYTTHISVDLAYHKIFHAKVGKGGINVLILRSRSSKTTLSGQKLLIFSYKSLHVNICFRCSNKLSQ